MHWYMATWWELTETSTCTHLRIRKYSMYLVHCVRKMTICVCPECLIGMGVIFGNGLKDLSIGLVMH